MTVTTNYIVRDWRLDAWAAEPLSGTAVESLCQRLNLPTPRGKS